MGNRWGTLPWSDAENELLRAIWAGGEPISESNRLAGRTLAAMRQQARRLSLSHRSPGRLPALREAILDLLGKGLPMSSREMATMFAKSQQSVDSVLRSLRESKQIRIAAHARIGDHVIRLWGIGCETDNVRPDSRRTVARTQRTRRTWKVREGKVVSSSPRVTRVSVARDPFTAAFFGEAA